MVPHGVEGLNPKQIYRKTRWGNDLQWELHSSRLSRADNTFPALTHEVIKSERLYTGPSQTKTKYQNMSSPFNPKPTFHSLKKTKTAAQSLPPQLPFTHLDLNYFSTIWPCLFNLPKPLEPFPLFSAWKLYLVQDWFNHRLLCEAFPSQTAQGFCLCLITAFDPTVLVYLSVNIIHNSLKDRNSFLFTFLLPPSNPGPPK